jgi:hypothetical protein
VSIFHLKHPHPKHEENSLRGIRKAARAKKWVRKGLRLRRVRRYTETDLDQQMTKADPHCPVCKPGTCKGHMVGTHWPEPMVHDGFRDPLGKLPRHTKVSEMTLPEVQRLEAGPKRHPYRIMTVERELLECARVNIGARLEPKGDKRFEDVEVWRPVKAYADSVGAHVRGYSIRNLGGKGAGVRRVRSMEAAGIPSKVIH